MTAKFLNNYPVRNALRVIGQNRKFAIILSILFLLGIPLGVGTLLLEEYIDEINYAKEQYYTYFDSGPYVAIAAICGVIAVALGIACGIRAFEEEWSKTRVDMLYSLPLNGTQRFFSDYIGGFLMYIVPYIVSVLLGWIIMFIMIPMINSVSHTNTLAGEDVNQIYLYYFLGSIGLGVLMWMYYTISAISASCCGTMFENIYTNILLNLLIPGTFAAVLAVITSNVSGLEFNYSWEFIGYMSPIGGLIYMFYLFGEYEVRFNYSYAGTYNTYGGTPEEGMLIPAYIRWIVVVIIVTAGLTVLAWKLYQHRKAEHVGKPFVYSWIYYLVITAVTICILCIDVTGDSLFAVLLFSAIVYFIMEVVQKRGFKKFWLSVVRYVATVAVTLGMFKLIMMTDCFGRERYIPSVATVSSVEISFEDVTSGRTSRYHLTYKDYDTIKKLQNFQKEYFTNHEVLRKTLNEKTREYHYNLSYGYSQNGYEYEDFLNNYSNSDWDYTNPYTSNFTITYRTIAGTSIHRSYSLYRDEYVDLMEICIGTDVYAEAAGRLMKARLLEKAEKYDEKTYNYYIPNNTNINLDYLWNGDAFERIGITNAEANLNLLAETYQQDMANLSFEDYCRDDIIGYVENLPVYISCTGTVNLLKDWKNSEFADFVDIFSAYTNKKLWDMMNNSDAYERELEIQIYAPENYMTGSIDYPSYLRNGNGTIRFKQNNAYHDTILRMDDMAENYPELMEAFRHMRQNYISAEPCYLMVINGEYFMIPEEYSEEVENIIALGNNYYNSMLWGTPSGTASAGNF